MALYTFLYNYPKLWGGGGGGGGGGESFPQPPLDETLIDAKNQLCVVD